MNDSKRPKTALFVALLLMLSNGCVTNAAKMRWAERLYVEGQHLLSKGKDEAAVRKFEKSLKMSKEIDFSAGVAHNLNELSIHHTRHGKYSEARSLLTRALEIYRDEGMAPEVSKAMNNMALIYIQEGRFTAAIDQYNSLLLWDRKTENQLGIAITKNNMGLVYERYLMQPAEARRNYLEALALFKELEKGNYIQIVEKNLERLN